MIRLNIGGLTENLKVKVTNKAGTAVKYRRELMAMVIFIIAALILTTTCGDDEPTKPGENSIVNTLKFTRQDGTDMTMGSDYAICCATWDSEFDEESEFDERFVLKIFFYHPESEDSFWKLFLVVDKISVGTSYSIQDNEVYMFILDATNSNEISSQVGESTVTITINSLDCDSPLEISFTIDVTLGSELNFPPVSVSGDFSATIHSNPSPFGCEFGL